MATNYDYILQMKPNALADLISCPYEDEETVEAFLKHCIFTGEEWPKKRDCHQCKLRFLLSDI